MEEEILKELKKQTIWLRLIALQSIKRILSETIVTQTEKKIYQKTDGIATTRAIAKETGVSHATIANYWKKWTKLGLLVHSEKYKGRYKKIVTLRETGII